MALVYSTDHGRACPGYRQSLTACICKAARPFPAGDGIVHVSREKQGRGGKTVAMRSLPPPVQRAPRDRLLLSPLD
jgi:translation initiation factor 1